MEDGPDAVPRGVPTDVVVACELGVAGVAVALLVGEVVVTVAPTPALDVVRPSPGAVPVPVVCICVCVRGVSVASCRGLSTGVCVRGVTAALLDADVEDVHARDECVYVGAPGRDLMEERDFSRRLRTSHDVT